MPTNKCGISNDIDNDTFMGHIQINSTDALPFNICLSSFSAGPNGRTVSSKVYDARDGSCRVEYIPTEVGVHNIEVMYADLPIQGSPFKSKAYDHTGIRIGTIPSGVVGQPCEFLGRCFTASSHMVFVFIIVNNIIIFISFIIL